MRRSLLASTLVPIIAALSLAGCITAPTTPAAAAFVLDYRLEDLGPGGEPRHAEPGHHCGDVRIDGERLTIQLWPGEARPDGPWLAVFPELTAAWRTGIGGEPFKSTFPASVHPRVEDDPTRLGDITWEPREDGGTLRVDGETVALPHAWRVTGADGSWRADATLRSWDGEVAEERLQGLCD